MEKKLLDLYNVVEKYNDQNKENNSNSVVGLIKESSFRENKIERNNIQQYQLDICV